MHDTQPTLLLTRPKAQSHEFLSVCEDLAGRALPALVSPILQIKNVDALPDLDPYATLIFTSANGVAACADAIGGRHVVTVGAKTCELANQAGADAKSLGEDVDVFLAQAGGFKGPALFCRGTHTRGDLASRLNAQGIKTEEAVVYDQIAQPLGAEALALLQSDARVVAPVFSPRSARLLCDTEISARLTVIAMSSAVADAWTGPGTIETISAPTAINMAKQVIRYF